VLTAALFFVAWTAYGYFSVRSVEELKYEVLEEKDGYEIREIQKHIRAETTVKGGFRESGNDAFRIIAGYIFGDNVSQEKIAMTAPVVQEESEKIAMTAPVIFEDQEDPAKDKRYAFVMPSKYTLENLPKPNDSRVELVEVEAYKVAVIRFSGRFTEANYSKHKKILIGYLERDGIEYSSISEAGYNPPFTPPYMRRNEVWALLK